MSRLSWQRICRGMRDKPSRTPPVEGRPDSECSTVRTGEGFSRPLLRESILPGFERDVDGPETGGYAIR